MDASPPVAAKLWKQVSMLLPTSRQTLFLRACVSEGPAAREAWHRWERDATRDGTPRRRALAPIRSFVPLLAWNLDRNGVKVDKDLATHFRSARLTEELRWRKYRSVCSSAFGALRAAAIPFIALKGAALSELIYPTPLLRHSNDLDVLLHEVDLQRAAAAFVEAGWRPRKTTTFRPGRHHYLTPIVHPSGVPIEFHRRLLSPLYALSSDALWSRSEEAGIAGVDVRILSGADNLLHVCADGICKGRTLRWVPDACFIVERYPDLDWSTFLSSARSARLGLLAYIAIEYLAHQMDAPIPARVLEELRLAAARTGLRGRCAARLAARPPSGILREIWRGRGALWRRPSGLAARFEARLR